MNNFDLTKYLAEGKLLKEELNGQEVKFLAQYIADAFTEEDAEGDRFSTYMAYTVGDIDGNSFELDTKATEKTPEDDAKYGTGRGWGGSFRIKPIEGGYEVRNSEKGGLVATISDQGELTMLDAEQSKAEMGGDTDYMERRKETDDYMQEVLGQIKETLDDEAFDMAEKIIDSLGAENAVGELVRAMSTDDAKLYLGGIIRDYDLKEEEVKEIKSNKMKKSELKEMIKAAMLEDARTDAEQEGYKDGFEDAKDDIEDKLKDMKVSEAEDVEVEDNEDIDVDIEKDVDVKVDDEESEVDVDIKASMPGESEDVEEVQALLMKAQEAAQAFGDEKLMDQIGNTITYFTRSHVAGNVSEMDDMDVNVNTTEMEAEMGLEEAKDEEVKENLNESVVFPMWNKIK
jgi:hypothetical protein